MNAPFSASSSAAPWVVMGGAFDPVHYGHLRSAFELLDVLRVPTIQFLPTGQPVHRPGLFAPNGLRLAMLRAAIHDQPRFAIDERELHRQGPSYTVDTLEQLRAEHPGRSLCFVVGLDAFLSMPTWHRAERVLDLAHVVVVNRPGFELPSAGPLKGWLDAHQTQRVADLHAAAQGRIYVHDVTPLAISATAIRDLLKQGQDPQFLLPPAVREIILQHQCYST